jgi:hypothetical protein
MMSSSTSSIPGSPASRPMLSPSCRRCFATRSELLRVAILVSLPRGRRRRAWSRLLRVRERRHRSRASLHRAAAGREPARAG